jgi:FkbM family methyltransferase
LALKERGHSLTKFFLKPARLIDIFLQTSKLNYTLPERINLVRAYASRNKEARLLDSRVKWLDLHSFRITLAEIFFNGQYRFDSENDSPLIFDCGANIGMATLYFKRAFPNASILAFEADPETAAVLNENVSANNLQNVTVYNLMLTNGEGEYSFFSAGAGNARGSSDARRMVDSREIKVKGGRLSQFVNSPVDLLKLDVEGSEYEVLTDLVETQKISMIRKMVIEYHHKIGGAGSRLAEFLKVLEENGFEYQVAAGDCDPVTRQEVFQDILIGAYRSPGKE